MKLIDADVLKVKLEEYLLKNEHSELDEVRNIFVMNCIEEIELSPIINEWISIEDRFPTKEEYLRNDGRFIATDGNRIYQNYFDIYDSKFVKCNCFGCGLSDDKCIIYWQNLPQPFKEETK